MQLPSIDDEWIYPGQVTEALDFLFTSQTGLEILNSIAKYLSRILLFRTARQPKE